MGRLIDARGEQHLPSALTIRVGDLLTLGASGGHVRSGAGVLELLGPFVPGVIATNGQVLSPIAAPNAVLFLARGPGVASIDVVTGDPWHGPKRTIAMDITVEP